MRDVPSLFSGIAGGVHDVRLPGISVLGSETERELGAGATGVQSMIGSYMVDRFEIALSCLTVSKEKLFAKQEIDVRFVLAQPWRLRRMADCMALRAEGPPPPIDVIRITFPGLPDLFQIVNGCHRAYAARQNGDMMIMALVHSVHTCDPEAFFLSGHALHRGIGTGSVPVSPNDPMGPEVSLERATISPDIVTILNGLGCRGASAPRAAQTYSFGTG
jgi:hypothetical protein